MTDENKKNVVVETNSKKTTDFTLKVKSENASPNPNAINEAIKQATIIKEKPKSKESD